MTSQTHLLKTSLTPTSQNSSSSQNFEESLALDTTADQRLVKVSSYASNLLTSPSIPIPRESITQYHLFESSVRGSLSHSPSSQSRHQSEQKKDSEGSDGSDYLADCVTDPDDLSLKTRVTFAYGVFTHRTPTDERGKNRDAQGNLRISVVDRSLAQGLPQEDDSLFPSTRLYRASTDGSPDWPLSSRPKPISPIRKRSYSTRCCVGTVSVTLTIIFISDRIFKWAPIPSSPFLTMPLSGFTSQLALDKLLPKAYAPLRDQTSRFAAFAYITFANISLNSPLVVEQAIVEMLLFYLGGLGYHTICTFIDQLKESLAAPINPPPAKYRLNLSAGRQRCVKMLLQGIAASGCLAASLNFPNQWGGLTDIGEILIGKSVGEAFYELLTLYEKRLVLSLKAQKPPDYGDPVKQLDPSIRRLRIFKQMLKGLSYPLSGFFLGFSSFHLDLLAGLFLGISRQADYHYFFSRHFAEIKQIKLEPSLPLTTCRKVGLLSKRLFGYVLVPSFLVYNMVIGTTQDKITLTSFGFTLYTTFYTAKRIDKKSIHPDTSRLITELFFLVHYPLPPILYIAIYHWTQIGNDAPNLALSLLAWTSLAILLGCLAAKEASKRVKTYPSYIDETSLAFFTYFLAENIS